LTTKQALWFLLFIVAISGASDGDLQKVQPEFGPQDQEIFLGVGHTDRELLDYPRALSMLRPKFESEFAEVFGSMVTFLTRNYTEP
jgi:hypothetical protein